VTYPSLARKAVSGAELQSNRYFRKPALDEFARLQGVPGWLGALALEGHAIDPPRFPATPPAESSGWPLVIFSPGTQCCLEMYTQLYREIASLGIVVVSVEHENGSGLYAENATTAHAMYEKSPGADFRQGKKDDHVEFRRPMLAVRTAEIRATMAALVALRDREERKTGNWQEALLRRLLDVTDMQSTILAGHEFGGTTVLSTCNDEVDLPVAGALLFDPDLRPLPEDMLRPWLPPVHIATIFSQSWAFAKHVPNEFHMFSRMRKPLFSCVIYGTQHHWVSDSIFFLPSWMLGNHIGMIGNASREEAHFASTLAIRQALIELLPMCFIEASTRSSPQEPLNYAVLPSVFYVT